MKVASVRSAAVLIAEVLTASHVAWGGSAMEVLRKVAPSIVVVLALD